MSVLVINNVAYGPFSRITEYTSLGYLDCDGVQYPLTVIGTDYTISTDNSLLLLNPVDPNQLVAFKTAKNLQINQWRATANTTTFTHLGKAIACDDLSRSDIDGVAGNISLTGGYPAGFPGAWKAVDNSYIILDTVQKFKDMYASMTAQGSTNFTHAQTLKTALAAATTKEAIDVISWS